MTRRKFVYDPETKEMVEVTAGRPADVDAPVVWGDQKEFRSPVTGEMITDRGQLRRHMKIHGIAPAHELAGTAERVRRERARAEAEGRKRSIIDAYEHTRNQERSRQRYG